ncbi:hypothetical protein HAX54_052963 [Datura stramonium]|uniref:Uncharacterized protein n=1 Tax=Datura stramonium TaxID=4076 RepID=A0ABS8SZN4_DATST|nr:hypothetical protein [Datura stramonium]
MLDMCASIQRRNIVQEPTNDKYNNFEGSLTQLTQIVSNNEASNDQMYESDSNRPLDDESTDGDQSSSDDGDVDGEIVAIGDDNINNHSNVIPYLDYTLKKKKPRRLYLHERY